MFRKIILFLLLFFSFNYIGNAIIEIENCTNLTVSGETYLLTKDILNSSISKCIDIQGNNIIFDCQGHLVEGNGIADNGIIIERSTEENTNNTIKNCNVNNWKSSLSKGNIYLSYVTGNTIINSNISKGYYGILIENIGRFKFPDMYNKIINVNLKSLNTGIRTSFADNINFTNSNICDINTGIYINGGWGNIYSNIIISNVTENPINFNYYYNICKDLTIENITDNFANYHFFLNNTITIDNWQNISSLILCNAHNSKIKNLNFISNNNKNTFLRLYNTNYTEIHNLTLKNYYRTINSINSNYNNYSLINIDNVAREQISFTNSNNNKIINSFLNSSGSFDVSGIRLSNSKNNLINNITSNFKTNGIGITLFANSDNNIISNSFFENNYRAGIHLWGENFNNTIINSSFSNNYYSDIRFEDWFNEMPENNLIQQNFLSKINFFGNCCKINNNFNKTIPAIGNIGNYWGDLICTETVKRGDYNICIDPSNYSIDTNNIVFDYAPLVLDDLRGLFEKPITIQCENNSIWTNCDNLKTKNIINKFRINCTSNFPEKETQNISLKLFDSTSSEIYFNNSIINYEQGWFETDNFNLFLSKLGNHRFEISCYNNLSESQNYNLSFFVSQGELDFEITQINPNSTNPLFINNGDKLSIIFSIFDNIIELKEKFDIYTVKIGEEFAEIIKLENESLETIFYDDGENWLNGNCAHNGLWDFCNINQAGEDGDLLRTVASYEGNYAIRADDFDMPGGINTLIKELDLSSCLDINVSFYYYAARLDPGDYGKLSINDGTWKEILVIDETKSYSNAAPSEPLNSSEYIYFEKEISSEYDFTNPVQFSWSYFVEGGGETVIWDNFNISCVKKAPIEFKYKEEIGWELNVTIPNNLEEGFYDLEINGSYLTQNISRNEINAIKITEVKTNYIFPTPTNNSNLIMNEIIFNVSTEKIPINCTLNINENNFQMTIKNNYCYYILNQPSLITKYNFSVNVNYDSSNIYLENRQFTYYPNYTENAMPAQGLISGLITILIIIGGLFL